MFGFFFVMFLDEVLNDVGMILFFLSFLVNKFVLNFSLYGIVFIFIEVILLISNIWCK